MRLLSCVNQVVFLQVGQLSEVLVAGLTPEGTLSTVHPQMDLRTALHYSVKLKKPWWLVNSNVVQPRSVLCKPLCLAGVFPIMLNKYILKN